MALGKALEGFALGALSEASGRDFLGPALDHQRQRDLFAFQRKQMEESQEKQLAKLRTQQRASQGALLKSLQAVGAFRPDDLVAVGGADALAGLEPAEFEVALSQMQEARLRDASKEERRAVLLGQAAAHGVTVSADADETELARVGELVAMRRLEKEEGRQLERDITNRATLRVSSDSDAIGQLARKGRTASAADVQQAESILTGTMSYLESNADNLQPEVFQALMRTAETARSNIAALTARAAANQQVSGLSQPAVLEAYAQADNEEVRAAMDETEAVILAKNSANTGAEYLLSLSDDEAAAMGLGDARARAVESGVGPQMFDDPKFAADLARVAARRGEYEETRKRRAANLQAANEARTMESALRASTVAMPDAINPDVRVEDFIKDGVFDMVGYAAEATKPLMAALPGMDWTERQKARRIVSKMPPALQAGAMAFIEEANEVELAAMSPAEKADARRQDRKAAIAGIGAVASLSPVAMFSPPEPDRSGLGFPYKKAPYMRANEEWTNAGIEAFTQYKNTLREQREAIEEEYFQLEAYRGQVGDDPDLNNRAASFVISAKRAWDEAKLKEAVYENTRGALLSIRFKRDEDVVSDLSRLGGVDAGDAARKQQIEGEVTRGADGILDQFQQTLIEKGVPDELAADQITDLREMLKPFEAALDGEDRDEVLKGLKRSGIISSTDSNFPEFEILSYFIGGQ